MTAGKNPLLDKTFVFRPLKDNGWLRYAAGEWIEDNGEPDLAFVSKKGSFGPARALYVHLPYYADILWKWMDYEILKHISGGLNHWHYQVVNPEKGVNTYWHDRNDHINEKVGQLAWSKCRDIHSYVNGGGPEIDTPNEYIDTGKIWILEEDKSLTLLKTPENPECYLCLNGMAGHYELQRLDDTHSLENSLKRLDIEEKELLKKLDDLQKHRPYLKKKLEKLHKKTLEAKKQ